MNSRQLKTKRNTSRYSNLPRQSKMKNQTYNGKSSSKVSSSKDQTPRHSKSPMINLQSSGLDIPGQLHHIEELSPSFNAGRGSKTHRSSMKALKKQSEENGGGVSEIREDTSSDHLKSIKIRTELVTEEEDDDEEESESFEQIDMQLEL